MIVSTAVLVEEDCTILLDRALMNKTVCAFGEDGFGLYGRQTQAQWFKIIAFDIDIEADEDDPMKMEGRVRIVLDGYDSDKTGHIMTDKNFEISLQVLLQNTNIDPAALYWPEDDSMQGPHHVEMRINVPLLIGYI